MLVVDDARIGKAVIRWFNRFEGPFSLTIEDGVHIGPSNRFVCLFDVAGKGNKHPDGRPMRYCHIGKGVAVGEKHLIDTTGGFQVGEKSWIGGCESQFWTHGPRNGPIVIGVNCYVSSAVRFAPGSSIGNHVLVAMGSVVTKNFRDNVMIGGGASKGHVGATGLEMRHVLQDLHRNYFLSLSNDTIVHRDPLYPWASPHFMPISPQFGFLSQSSGGLSGNHVGPK